MEAVVRYVLDANIFIEAKQRYYAFDVCPGFWNALVWHHGRGCVLSIDRIRQELRAMGDELQTWVEGTMPEACFAASDSADCIAAYGQAMQWVNNQARFTPEARAEFAQVADGWLVAYARATGAIVVTQEQLRPDSRRRVFIPDVCQALNVQYIDTFGLLRAVATQFDWQPVAAGT
jgi:hypothetical protein